MKLASTLALALASVTVSLSLQAATGIVIPVATLHAPVIVAPLARTVVYNYQAPNLTFVWDQSPAIRSPADLLPTHFLICLHQPGPACTHANAAFNVPVNGTPNTVIRAPGTFQPTGYRYSYTPIVPDIHLDDNVGYSVGACATPADSSCKFSARTWVIISTWDLHGRNTSGSVFGNEYRISAEIENLGSRSSAPSAAVLSNSEVLLDPATGDCHVNPNDPAIRNELTLISIDKYGNSRPFGTMHRDPAGNFDQIADIRGIFRPNSTFEYHSIYSTDAVVTPGRLWSFRELLIINVPVATRPRAFLSAVQADANNTLYEANETNNMHVDCEVVF